MPHIYTPTQPYEFQSPERQQRNFKEIANQPIHCQDVYAVGRVLQLAYPEGLPDSLTKYVDKMLLLTAAKRPTPAQVSICVL